MECMVVFNEEISRGKLVIVISFSFSLCVPKEKILQAMFKDIHYVPKKEIAATFASVGDVNRAAELLLLKKSSSVDSDDELDYCAWDETMDKPSCCTQGPQTLERLMQIHQLQLRKDGCNRLTVNREELWCDSIVLFKSPDFCVEHPLRIRFQGEAGVDAGGLSREYATLLRNALFSAEARLFEGQSNRRLPLYNGDAVLGNMFVLAGKMVSYLISHYDVGIPCLTQAASYSYMYICTSDIEVASQKWTAEDIPDPDLQDVILKARNIALTWTPKLWEHCQNTCIWLGEQKVNCT